MIITVEVPDEDAKYVLDEVKNTLKMLDIDLSKIR
jgi:hypothetical protein